MTKGEIIWVINWRYCEYGGYCFDTGPSYHLTCEEAEAYKERREGAYQAFEDGFRYEGSEPYSQVVSKDEYERIKMQGH